MLQNFAKKAIFFIVIILFQVNNIFSQIIPPYQNDFDSNDTLGWSHYAISGTDDWKLTTPQKVNFTSAYSAPKAWVTNKTGNFSANSNRVLQTPCFDLSDTTQKLVFSFYHKTDNNSTPYTFIVEYSLNNGSTWSVLTNSITPKKYWQGATGFSTNIGPSYSNAAINIKFLQGNPSVCFRFRFTSAAASGDGWIIDNFSIKPEFYNVQAVPGDTIRNINHFFTQFQLKFNFQFDNQYTVVKNFTNNFYLSKDQIKDGGDIAIGTRTLNASATVANWTNTLTLPPNLNAGTYYVLYDLDVTNVLNENIETDNSNFTVLLLDSIYNSNYVENFDTTYNKWNTTYSSGASLWKQEPPNYFRMEKAHSGNNAFSTKVNTGGVLLETPYLDLSHKTNQSICFWYKMTNPFVVPKMQLRLPPYQSFKSTAPSYLSGVQLPSTKNNDWGCFCYKLGNAFDTIVSTKFAIAPSTLNVSAEAAIYNYSRNAIDDVYIGECKPDASIDFRDGNHFTCSSKTSDTLYYDLYNSGLASLPSSTTKFFWSTDSIFDAGDILFATQTEPLITDTTSIKRKLFYTKPNLTPGTYFIIYQLDFSNSVSEMREYNNIGYVKVIQNLDATLPYFNDFETNTTNWVHQANLGNDDWICSTPSKPNITSVFSGTKAWLTNATGNASQYSKMHLYTPVFDLTQLNHPVLEFDMKLLTYGVNGYSFWPYNALNMSYSIDGGLTWAVLDTTNNSFARWYHAMEFESVSGVDQFVSPASYKSTVISSKDENNFINYFIYQTRDGLNTTHYVVDLDFIKSKSKIIFRYNYANVNAPVDGAMIDNFKLSEATIDYAINEKKDILAAPTDKYISTFFNVNNNGNYTSPQSEMKLYLSTDTILDGADVLFTTKTITSIRPVRQFYSKIKGNTNLLSSGYTYLIYQLDPQNLVVESNETNNTGYFKLCNNTSLSLPYFNDFNNANVDGWSEYNDSAGFYLSHRFRNKLIMGDNAYLADDGEWFLDRINYNGSSFWTSGYPVYYLESPTFNFSGFTNYLLEFDFSCVGTNGSPSQGGNIQYSINGGLNWNVISYQQDPSALNLYAVTSTVTTLGNLPGWKTWFNNSNCKINLSFLSGAGNVKFRYAFKGGHMYINPSEQGFRMDNFKISALIATDVASLENKNYSLRYLDNNRYEIVNEFNCDQTQVQVFDIQGKIVSNEKAISCSDKAKVSIDLSHVKPGMYLIHLTQNNQTKTYKVIAF